MQTQKTDYKILLEGDNYVAYKDDIKMSSVSAKFGVDEILHSIYILEGAKVNNYYYVVDKEVWLDIHEYH